MTRKSKRRIERDQAAAQRQVQAGTQAQETEQPPQRAWIEVHEDTYVRTLWYVDAERFNVLGWMFKHANEPWRCGYRFRHYRDKNAFNSADEKNGYRLEPKSGGNPSDEDLEQIAQAIDFSLGLLAKIEGCEIERLDVNATGLATVGILQTREWAHVYAPGATNIKHQPPGQA